MARKDKRKSSQRQQITQNKDSERHSLRRKKQDRNGKNYWVVFGKTLVIVILVAILCGILYFIKGLMDTNDFLDKSYSPRASSNTDNANIDVQKDPISILILGLDDNDERNIGSARTDSMLLLTVNPTEEKVSMVSIPRDTYTTILSSSYEGKDKINAAFAYGGIDSTIDTVENLIDVPINYYVTVDFQAFEEIVDALDGIEVDVPFTLTEQNAAGKKVVNLTEGKHVLNGEEALAFARTRHIDNDIERGKRQQQVLEAVAKKAASAGTISKYKNILEALDGHIKTDMESNKILSIVQSGLTKNYTFDSYVFSWFSFDYAPYGESMSMVGLYQDSLDYITHELRLSLGLDQKDERDADGYEFETNEIIDEETFPNDGMAVMN